MIGGKDWLSLIVVSAVALGFITLMVVIQALQHERSRGEIIRGVGLIWGALGLTLLLAWLLEGYWGGAVIDVQIAPEPQVVTRSLTGAQTAILTVMLAALLALYVIAVLTVKRLVGASEELAVRPADRPPDGSEGADE